MKKLLALLLALTLCVSMAACTNTPEETVPETKETVPETKDIAQEPVQQTFRVFVVNALIDGESVVELTKTTTVTATAAPEEGCVVDCWMVDGVKQEDSSANTFTYTAEKDTIIEPVFRAEKKVTTINCKLQFLNKDGKAEGQTYEEFVFEKPYKNPVTGEEVADGTITLQVAAVIPNGYVVDYWKINGVPYRYGSTVTQMVVENLDEATEYEVVLKEKGVTYYKVTTSGCTVNGKTETWVAAGTTVTAVANNGASEFYVNGVKQNDKFNDPLVTSWTFTVTGDTYVEAMLIVN